MSNFLRTEMTMARRISVAVLLATCLVFSAQAARPELQLLGDDRPLLQQSLVDKINGHPEATWKVRFNDRFAHHMVKHLKKMCGTIMTPVQKLEPSISSVRFNHKNLRLSKAFDAREAWSRCPTIGAILGGFMKIRLKKRCFWEQRVLEIQ